VSREREGRAAFFGMLADGQYWLELRRYDRGRWLKDFARSPDQADELAHRHTTVGADVYVGLLPRLGRDGDDQRRYAPAQALAADCDSVRAVRNLEAYEPQPTAIVRSGGRDGDTPKQHAYWATPPIPADQYRRHALRLAHHLGADRGACDAGRILRVPGSRSHKTGRVARLVDFTGEVYDLEELTGDLEDPPNAERPHEPIVDDGYRVPEGHRYHHLIRFAGLLRSAGLNEEAIVRMGLVFLEECCEQEPAMDLDHAKRGLRNAVRRWEPRFTPKEERQ
jgi:hypothetical protein